MNNYNPFGTSAEAYFQWLKQLQQNVNQPASGQSNGLFAPFFQAFTNPQSNANAFANQSNQWNPMANWTQQFGAFAPYFQGMVNPQSNATGSTGAFTNWMQPTTDMWTQLQQFTQNFMNQLQGLQVATSPWMNQATNPYAYASQMYDFSPLNLAIKPQRLQHIAMQLCALAANPNDTNKNKQELGMLIRNLVQEVHNMAANQGVMQYINQVRMAIGMQRTMLEEQLVHASLTPYRTDVEQVINTCKLWYECCESLLAMFDIYQQFSEHFSEVFSVEFAQKITDDTFDCNDSVKVLDFFVQCYEREFGELLRSESFGKTYGQLTDSISATRIDQQQYIDKIVEAFGLPSKREMDTTHQRANKHQKTLRVLESHVHTLRQAQQQIPELTAQFDQLRLQVASLHTSVQTQMQSDKTAELTAQFDQLRLQVASLHTSVQTQMQSDKTAELTAQLDQLRLQVANLHTSVQTQIQSDKTAELTAQFDQLRLQVASLHTSVQTQMQSDKTAELTAQLDQLRLQVASLHTSVQTQVQSDKTATTKVAAKSMAPKVKVNKTTSNVAKPVQQQQEKPKTKSKASPLKNMSKSSDSETGAKE